MRVFLDSHVHVYPPIAPARWAENARRRLAAAARGSPWYGLLGLTASAREGLFAELASNGDAAKTLRAAGWRVAATDAPWALELTAPENAGHIALLAGRQLVSAERLEALALGVTTPLPEGQSLADTVAAIQAAGGAAILPWGAGKWLGARGETLHRYLETAPKTVALGDSRHRPLGWPEPRLFRAARTAGRPVWRGSDPLPGEPDAAAACGHELLGWTPGDPWPDFLRALGNPARVGPPFGRRLDPLAFIGRQWALRRNRREPR